MSLNIVNKESIEDIFNVLCRGMDEVVHKCAKYLGKCYSDEEIIETKVGQLELTKQVSKTSNYN